MGAHQRNDVIIEAPLPGDRQTMAALLAEDMRDQNIDQDAEALLAVADLALNDQAGQCFCRVLRPGPGQPAAGLVLANIIFSVKFAGQALWIENLYVSKSWRRRGYGRLLVSALLDWAEDHDIKGIDLEAYQGNTPAAILYRTLGFERLNRERFYFAFSWLEED